MIPYDEIDNRLKAIGKNRAWLAERSGRSPGSLRAALAPNANPKNRTNLLQRALSETIEREEADQAAFSQPIPPGMTNVFLNDEMLDRADRASRQVNSSSLAEFCRDAILFRADEILAGNEDPVPLPFTPPASNSHAPYPKPSALPPVRPNSRRAK